MIISSRGLMMKRPSCEIKPTSWKRIEQILRKKRKFRAILSTIPISTMHLPPWRVQGLDLDQGKYLHRNFNCSIHNFHSRARSDSNLSTLVIGRLKIRKMVRRRCRRNNYLKIWRPLQNNSSKQRKNMKQQSRNGTRKRKNMKTRKISRNLKSA